MTRRKWQGLRLVVTELVLVLDGTLERGNRRTKIALAPLDFAGQDFLEHAEQKRGSIETEHRVGRLGDLSEPCEMRAREIGLA